MKQRCFGIKDNLRRCSRTGDWSFFCHDHKRQPIVWMFGFIFTVIGGSASIYSVIESKAEVTTTYEQVPAMSEVESLPLSLRGVINKNNLISFSVASDVALISIFDPLALEHRFRDRKDWWIDNSELVREMNRGNGIFLATGFDGYFEVLVHGKSPRIKSSVLSMKLVCEGGLMYVGGYPNDGLSKVQSPFGGDYFSCEKGVYNVEIRKRSNVIDLSFSQVDIFSRNGFENIPHFDEFE